VTVDYDTLARDVESGEFRTSLESELIDGFRQIQESGERLPTASHYASQIAAIIDRNAQTPLDAELAFEVYQEVLAACERARDLVTGAAN
jgi:hypothetical protein